MRAVKTAVFILLALLLTVGVAVLPQTVADLQDEIIHSQPNYGTIQTIQLNLQNDGETSELSTVGKIAAACQSLYSISDDKASMTRDEVLSAVDIALEPYYESDLIINEWADAEKSVMPYISFGVKGKYCIIWEVAFSGYSGESFYSLNLYLDDSTGNILSISYQADQQYFSKENSDAQIQTFVDNYFQAWNLDYSMDNSGNNGFIEQVTANPSVFAAKQYTLNDIVYGEIIVVFLLHGTGFNMSVSRK